MRIFSAIDLPEDQKDQIWRAIEPLRKEYAAWKWVPADTYHLTLQYYGDRAVEPIDRGIQDVAFDLDPFSVSTGGINVFQRHQLAIYLEVKPHQFLTRLVRRLDERLQFERNGLFIPHITLARARKPSKQQYLHLKKHLQAHYYTTTIDVGDITIFDTVDLPHRVQYRSVAQIPLGS